MQPDLALPICSKGSGWIQNHFEGGEEDFSDIIYALVYNVIYDKANVNPMEVISETDIG